MKSCQLPQEQQDDIFFFAIMLTMGWGQVCLQLQTLQTPETLWNRRAESFQHDLAAAWLMLGIVIPLDRQTLLLFSMKNVTSNLET